MKTPIVAIERGGEIHIFSSQDEAEAYIEPLDVRYNEYEIYEADGSIVDARVGKGEGFLAPEKTLLMAGGKIDRSRLQALLGAYLKRLGEKVDENESLEKLIELSVRHKEGR